MKKFAIIFTFIFAIICLLGCIFYGYTWKNNVPDNNAEIANIEMQNEIVQDNIKGITENLTREEIIETSNKTTEVETVKKKESSKTNNKTLEDTKSKVVVTETIKDNSNIETNEQETVKIETNVSEPTPTNPETKQEEPTPEIPEETKKEEVQEEQKELKNGYFYNAEASNFLVNEFKRITNNDINFTVRIDSKAKESNPFWPYKESELIKQVCNTTFGYFIVYAEDFYKDDVKQRTLYYIELDV